VQLVEKWETHHGAERTVVWLKSLKTDFVRMLAGLEPCGAYAKKTHRMPDGRLIRIPKGPFGGLFVQGLTAGNSRRKYHKVWQALIIHTRFVSREVRWNQWRKFSSAVRKPKPTKSELREARRYVSSGLGTLPKPGRYEFQPKPLITFQPREGKRIPHGRKTLPESNLLHQLRAVLSLNVFDVEVCKDLIEPVVAGTPYAGKVISRGYPVIKGAVRPLHHVGTIGFIQEPGFKLRAVANPNRVLQRALDPLGEFVFRWLGRVHEDCCYHQELGVFAVQGKIAEGQQCHSIDLSNATDLYPYEICDMVLAFARVPGSARRLLEGVSRGTWQVPFSAKPISKKVRELQWARGIPLGLRPCFALFSLSHHALVRGICVELGRYSLPSGQTDLRSALFPYRILGDDIVIWDDSVAVEYKRILGIMGCSIALEKSISSSRVAEFAGRVILPNVILHGLKYGDETHDNSFLEQVKSMGPRTIKTLLPKQREVARYLSEAAAPIGFGWNPRGLPYTERLARAMAWEMASPRKSDVGRAVQIRVAMANWYSYRYSDISSHRLAGSEPRSKAWDPLSIDQIDSRPEFLGIPVEAFAGNVEDVLQLQRVDKGLKDEFFTELLRGWHLLSGGPIHDHPYNKPLIQSLYPRLKRAREILPSVRAMLVNPIIGPGVDQIV